MLLKRLQTTVGRSSHRIRRPRIWNVFLWGILGLAGIMVCSREHESPIAFHKTLLGTPSDLKVEFVNDERIVLTWTMDDTMNVAGYAVSISDGEGPLRESLVQMTTYIEESILNEGGRVDSTWYYFQVCAVDANLFKGPPSPVDSVLVY